jgi:hypothetical protein
MLPISDGSTFDQLKLLVDSEGDNLAGPDWLGMLAAIGIVRGKPFTPDASTRTSSARPRSSATKRTVSSASKKSWAASPIWSIQTIIGLIPSLTGHRQSRQVL